MLLYKLIQILFEDPIQFLITITVLILPLLISITVHEWAHGFTAYKFGDSTPQEQGRLTFNPFAHLDPLGTLMLFILGIGWAKPVQINPDNIKNKFKLMLVAFAGPFSNFVLAFFFILVLYFSIVFFNIDLHAESPNLFIPLLFIIIRINFVLGLFNLLPLPPLDGANIISNLLPEKMANSYFKLAPYSLPILLLLMFSGGIKYVFLVADLLTGIVLVLLDTIFKLIV